MVCRHYMKCKKLKAELEQLRTLRANELKYGDTQRELIASLRAQVKQLEWPGPPEKQLAREKGDWMERWQKETNAHGVTKKRLEEKERALQNLKTVHRKLLCEQGQHEWYHQVLVGDIDSKEYQGIHCVHCNKQKKVKIPVEE